MYFTKQKISTLVPEQNAHHFLIIIISLLAGSAVIAVMKSVKHIITPDSVVGILALMAAIFMTILFYTLFIAIYKLRKLLFSANRLDTLLKNLPGIVYRCTNRENWPMEYVSEGCYELCGYHSQDLVQQRVLWGKFTHPDEVERLKNTIDDAANNGNPFEIEYRIVTALGEERWVWERGRVVDSVNGKDIYLEGFITDITDRKKAETAALESEAYAKAVVDTAIEGVITIDNSGSIETINFAAQEMFGYIPDEIKGKNLTILVAENYHQQVNDYINNNSINAELNTGDAGCEVVARGKDGFSFPVHLTARKMEHHSGEKIVGIIRDLSMQRAVEKELREQRELLAHTARLNTLGEMATGIAHEINQPLTAISMYSQSCLRFLRGVNPNYNRLKDALEKLSIQSHRAGAVLERVQNLSKQHDSLREEVNCSDLVTEVYKLAEVEAHMRHITIALEISADVPMVFCDPIQIQQVLLNLLRNGMEAMCNAKCLNGNQIILCVEGNSDAVRISVIDSGNGVTESVSEKLFQPFSSTKDTGMGLGLSISRAIINAHGGELKYFNNDKNGATFYFALPIST